MAVIAAMTSRAATWPLTRIALILWVIIATAMMLVHLSAITTLTMTDTDDLLRLVQVRDLLAGQPWWDVTQHRLNPADGGVVMHWSRIVDAPLAAGIALVTPLTGVGIAERVVLALVPLLLLGGTFAACARAYGLIGDRLLAIIALVMLGANSMILFQFEPLRIDHHGWQIMLAGVMLAALLSPATARSGIIGGCAAAILLTISLEGLPLVALFAAILGWRWALTGRPVDRMHFGGHMLALAGSVVAAQWLTHGPTGISAMWCDALSAPYLSAIVIGGVGMAVAALAADRLNAGKAMRIVALALCVVFAAAVMLAVAPQCSRGPFAALDPIVVDYWYNHIHEGLPFWRTDTRTAVYMMVPIAVGIIGSTLAWRNAASDDARSRWLMLLLALIGAGAVAVMVLRAASVAQLFALPGCAWLALTIWRRARAIDRVLPRIAASVLAGMAVPSVAANATLLVIGTAAPQSDAAAPVDNAIAAGAADDRPCITAADAAALNRLAAATVLSPLDLGPDILSLTNHSVYATGHHRNNRAMADAIATFIGPASAARDRMARRDIGLVIVCQPAGDFDLYLSAQTGNFADALASGRALPGMTAIPMPANSRLTVWQITS
jgi:hypothetical protein